MQLAEKHAVRFAKMMTCLNIGCPLGMGIWEGVPLREVVWLTQPARRPAARLLLRLSQRRPQADVPQLAADRPRAGRPVDLPPVILCYKLNGQWLIGRARRAGADRRARGLRLQVASSGSRTSCSRTWPYANDTYAEQGNDVDSPLKTFAATLSVPAKIKPGEPIPITGYAQVGIGGLRKVQVWISPADAAQTANDPYFQTAPWRDMEILSAPKEWGGGLPDDKIPTPRSVLIRGRAARSPGRCGLRCVHWAGVHPGLPAGKYMLRSRAVDEMGNGQPMPRPFRKSGHAAIEEVPIAVG